MQPVSLFWEKACKGHACQPALLPFPFLVFVTMLFQAQSVSLLSQQRVISTCPSSPIQGTNRQMLSKAWEGGLQYIRTKHTWSLSVWEVAYTWGSAGLWH